MRRLYFRIYLAVLASLFVFGLLAAVAALTLRSIDEDDRRSFFSMGAEVAERMLASERGPQALRTELEFWRQITGFSIMLVAPDGGVLAQAGEFPPRVIRDIQRGYGPPWRMGGRVYRMRLKDGRRLVALRPTGAFDRLKHLRWIAALLGIGLAVGIAAYPVVRQLTRRLERLQQGVAAFGEGDLSARVNISGRDEIAKLAETFNASAGRIEHLLNAHKTLLANASHELRSPLSRLRMAVERLGSGGGGETEAAQAEIRRNIAELDTLVEEILLASRLQAGAGQDFRPESVDLLGLLAEECAPYNADLAAEGATLPPLHGDPRLLRRLFRNLLENAARYGGAGQPDVTVRDAGGRAEVSVCDRGPGVPKDEREKIFEPFYRLRNRPESAGGAGLGLALVRQIAERHGGEARCLPREGGGTCFRVTLPLAPARTA
jgi:signal transduction histidine kinase